jgi:hypothetical protein
LTSGHYLSVPRCGVGGEAAGVPSDFIGGVLAGILEMISRKDENASKHHILKNIAPKMLKPILVDFLGVDLQCKNIVCKICDTFV